MVIIRLDSCKARFRHVESMDKPGHQLSMVSLILGL